MQIKPIYTVHGPNHNKTNFKGNQVKKATFRRPRPQGFSLKKMSGAPFFKGKALGTRFTFRQLFLTHSLLESRVVFWSLSCYKELKLPTNRFTGRTLHGLLIQMQNISLRSSGMRRKQNFDISFWV